jgi:hypothetical protein
MKHLITILFAVFLSTSLFSQQSGIEGFVFSEGDTAVLIKVTLLHAISNDAFTTRNGFDGKYAILEIPNGDYFLTTGGDKTKKHIQDSLITIKSGEILSLNLHLKSCDIAYPLKTCSECGNSKHVVRIGYDLVFVSRQFSTEKKHINYLKAIAKRGYMIEDYDGTLILVSVFDKELHEKLESTTICDKLNFCTKHKMAY